MRFLLLIAVLFTLPACTRWPEVRASLSQPQAPAGPAAQLAHARQQLELGNTALAIDAFRQILRQEPASLAALNGLAAAYDRLARFDLSQRYYEQALGFDPNSPLTLNNFGYSLLLQGRLAEAQPLLAAAAAGADSAVRERAQANLARLWAAPALLAQARAQSPAALPEKQLASWIGRVGPSTQMLVTRAPKREGIDPAASLAVLAGAEPAQAAPDVVLLRAHPGAARLPWAGREGAVPAFAPAGARL